ncbi:MAG: hypothetical protein ABI818_11700 [Acidobacteriota bacterium]
MGAGPDNYAWFQNVQTRLEGRAIEVYRSQGFAFIPRLKEAFPATERPLPVRASRASRAHHAWLSCVVEGDVGERVALTALDDGTARRVSRVS